MVPCPVQMTISPEPFGAGIQPAGKSPRSSIAKSASETAKARGAEVTGNKNAPT